MSRSGALSVDIDVGGGNLRVLCNGSHLLQLTFTRFLWMQRVARAF
jgi:hypothetical protein